MKQQLYNSDGLTNIAPIVVNPAFRNGFGGRCLSRTKDIEKKFKHLIEFGMVFAYDKANRNWFHLYGFHFWNVDEQENIYDSFSQLDHAFQCYMKDGTPLKKEKVLEIDGDQFRWLKEEPSSDTVKYFQPVKFLNKHFTDKNADLIYIRNHGYNMDFSYLNWDMVEKLGDWSERIEEAAVPNEKRAA
jgi:hypothetical protein